MRRFDVVVIGAGAAGMMCAATAGKRGRSVLVVDHADAPGKKIRISGGGRCNFTNIHSAPSAFLSANPRFAISALKRYTPAQFIALVDRYGIAHHEKALGQLFCDGSAQQIIDMLVAEMRAGGVSLELEQTIDTIERAGEGFRLRLASGVVEAQSVVVATGGKSIPKMGATGFAYRVAEQFGLAVTETRPGLVPLTFEPGMLSKMKPLAGVATDAIMRHGKTAFQEGMLFTHRGLSGPSVLQISSYWREGDAISVDLAPGIDMAQWVDQKRQQVGGQSVTGLLATIMPRRIAEFTIELSGVSGRIGDLNKKQIQTLCDSVSNWLIKPVGSEGYRTAEVTLGGIDTAGLSSTDMQAKSVPGLFFIGEAVDVTGWLGGYNFQWAWSSAHCAGQAA